MGWTGPDLVCRAVRLVLDGALDHGGEADLGARLGISPRHLRRLFATHLGVTPDGLARSARVHFARRLLDDTDLTVTEIAFAAGFGSLRQFNRACRDVFRESPRMLRARRRKADRLVADGGLLLRLPFYGPLDWDALLAYFVAHGIPGVEHVAGQTYRRVVVIDGYPGVLELLPGDESHLLLRAHLPRWGELVHVVQRARRIASLDLNVQEAVQTLAADPTIAPLVQARSGVRPPGAWDPFESGVYAILARDVASSRANELARKLVDCFGVAVAGLEAFGLGRVFPPPSTVADADLTRIGLSGELGVSIRAFANAVADDVVRLDGSASLDEFVASIAALDGLDASTAHEIALRAGEPDAAPDEHLAERWRPWRAVATTHLRLAARAGSGSEIGRDRGAA
jgi:AraC family transcriptional regulator of adaptative response / DNA-3-methyladenine glycosylase II